MINNTYNPWTATATLTPRKKNYLPLFVAVTGLVIVALVLVYSGGFDAALKFLGAGASDAKEIVITGADDWLGTNNDPSFNGGASMQSTGVFTEFPNIPADPDTTPDGTGFVTAIFNNSADANPEAGTEAPTYLSPVLDLGETSSLLEFVAVMDYVPDGTQVIYSYRFSDDLVGLADQEFIPLELSVINADQNINNKDATINQAVSRYGQMRLNFDGNISSDIRPAVYSLMLQYSSNAGDSGAVGNNNLGANDQILQRNISIQYSEMNAPESADVSIISADLDKAVAYLAEGVNLSERNSLSIDTSLTAGAYALRIVAPGINAKIVPFVVGDSSDIVVNAGSFEAGSSNGLSGDLSGDGVVNTVDLLILFNQFSQ